MAAPEEEEDWGTYQTPAPTSNKNKKFAAAVASRKQEDEDEWGEVSAASDFKP